MSQLIDINNYEVFAMDFIEGNLDEEMTAAFRAFLLANPTIAEEFEGIDELILSAEAETLSPDFKADLKMDVKPTSHIHEQNLEESFALAVDQDLNPSLSAEIQTFLKANPAFEKDYQLYQKTKVRPDLSVVFNAKTELKQPVGLWVAYKTNIYRAAAAITLLIGVATAINFLNNAVYLPRTSFEGFSSIEIDPTTLSPKISTPMLENGSSNTLIAEAKTVRSVELIEPLPTKEILFSNNLYAPESRNMEVADLGEIPNYFDEASEPVYLASNDKAPEYSLPQFLGKKIFGIEPKTDDTREIIKEGIANLVDQNDRVAINRSEPENDKSTFELLAGKFEFKRVSYK